MRIQTRTLKVINVSRMLRKLEEKLNMLSRDMEGLKKTNLLPRDENIVTVPEMKNTLHKINRFSFVEKKSVTLRQQRNSRLKHRKKKKDGKI